MVYVFIGLYAIGLVSFSQWGDSGAIAETVITVLLACSILGQQYKRVKEKNNESSDIKVYEIQGLIVIACIAVICSIPQGVWINRILLLALAIIHGYGFLQTKDEKKLNFSFLRLFIFSAFCLVMTLVFDAPMCV